MIKTYTLDLNLSSINTFTMTKTLFFRFLMIIVIPILLLQFIGLYVFYERHWDSVFRKLEHNLTSEIKTIYTLINVDGFDKANKVAALLDYSIHQTKKPTFCEGSNCHDQASKYLDFLSAQIAEAVSKPVISGYLNNGSDIIVAIEQTTDKFYQFQFFSKKLYSSTVNIFFWWMIGSAILLIIISVIFMKNQVRAILELAEVAEKLGKNQDIDEFKPSGAKEVRVVGQAFIKMKARLKRQIYYRTQLLAHISHDLRTPLTRLRLNIELIKNNTIAKDLKYEIKLMENIINEYLNFAKEEGNEKSTKFDVVAQLKKIISAYNNDKIIFTHTVEQCNVTLKPHSLDRAINNLIDNALKYYSKKITIELLVFSEYWHINIDDDGKGIPKKYYKKVFLPFFKINKDFTGFGLGLAAVKSIIYSQGGKIVLSSSMLGGLRVMIKIPF